MSYLLYFKFSDKFNNFSIQEFKSLLSLYEINIDNLFSIELNGIKDKLPDSCYDINYSIFKYYPFVIINDIDEDILIKILKRSVLLHDVIKLYGVSNNWKEYANTLNKEDLSIQLEKEDTFSFISYNINKKIKKDEQISIIESLPIPQLKGKVDIKNPNRIFTVCQLFKDINKEGTEKKLRKVYFGRSIYHNSDITFNHKYNLSNRIYLGPTSTDNNLSFLMANQALATSNKLIFDPFFGTGSLIIPVTHFGSFGYGGEIDIRVIKGWAVGRLNKQSNYKVDDNKKINYLTNFKQYGLPEPEVINLDCKNFNINTNFNNFFDSIICDPPYGFRAAAKKCGKENKNNNKEIKNNYKTIKSEFEELLIGLYNFAYKILKSNGRLVFLYPITPSDIFLEYAFIDERFRLIDYSVDELNSIRYRVLVTLEKK